MTPFQSSSILTQFQSPPHSALRQTPTVEQSRPSGDPANLVFEEPLPTLPSQFTALHEVRERLRFRDHFQRQVLDHVRWNEPVQKELAIQKFRTSHTFSCPLFTFSLHPVRM